jgi:hypothetical protein
LVFRNNGKSATTEAALVGLMLAAALSGWRKISSIKAAAAEALLWPLTGRLGMGSTRRGTSPAEPGLVSALDGSFSGSQPSVAFEVRLVDASGGSSQSDVADSLGNAGSSGACGLVLLSGRVGKSGKGGSAGKAAAAAAACAEETFW